MMRTIRESNTVYRVMSSGEDTREERFEVPRTDLTVHCRRAKPGTQVSYRSQRIASSLAHMRNKWLGNARRTRVEAAQKRFWQRQLSALTR